MYYYIGKIKMLLIYQMIIMGFGRISDRLDLNLINIKLGKGQLYKFVYDNVRHLSHIQQLGQFIFNNF